MLAIIPARGGSKRLPGKNIRDFGGEPLICHTIRSAICAKNITRVVVSTDDDQIASIAKLCGAEVPFIRPDQLSTDDSMAIDVYLHTISQVEDSRKIDSFVVLLPTSPLRLSKDIDNAVDLFREKKADSVVSVTKSTIPVEWYRKIDKNGVLRSYFQGEKSISNHQEYSGSYIPNGSIYIFNTEKLKLSREYYLDKTYPYIMPFERSIDIDTLEDFRYAEFLLKTT